MPNFRSDNETPVAAPVMEALLSANAGTAYAYADDQWSGSLDEAFSELFATPTQVLPLSTGTAANSIGLATASPPWGSVLCHRDAHIYCDEGGCPEFFVSPVSLKPKPCSSGQLGSRNLNMYGEFDA